MEQNKEKIIDSVYFDVGDGGIKFSIIDEGYGPTIQIKSSAFGNARLDFRVLTDKSSLEKVAEFFYNASKKEYSKDYIYKAKIK